MGTGVYALEVVDGAGLGHRAGPPCLLSAYPCLTCRHEEDAGAQDDVVACLVKLARCDAEATHEEQDHTQDGEDTGGPHGPCRTQTQTPGERQKCWGIEGDEEAGQGIRALQIQPWCPSGLAV